MSLDLGRIVSRSFSITWRHRWLWLLGVFGGGGVGARGNYNFGSSPRQGETIARFVSQHMALLVAALAVLAAIVLLSVLLACVAVPAATWAALQLDAGREVGLRLAWREGSRRFWRYLRLVLLKGLISLVIAVAVAVLGGLGYLVYAAGGPATLLLLVPLAVLLFVAFIGLLLVVSLGLAWSDRLLVILGVGAVDSIRAGWWLFRHNKLNTVVLAVVVGVINIGLGIALLLVAALAALPGIGMLVFYFAGPGASSLLAIIGAAWVIVLGGGVFLVGAGFLGAFNQVAYALAARDLSVSNRLQALPEVIGWDAGPATTVPLGLAPA